MKLSDIRDLETAKKALALMEGEISRLHERLEAKTRELAALKGESGSKQLEMELVVLKEQMAEMQNRLFGASSERRAGDASGERPAKQSAPPRPRLQRELPVVEREHRLDEDSESCEECGGELCAWDEQFEEFEEVDVVEREFRLVRHKRQKYRCSCGAAPVTAPGPLRIPGASASLDFMIAIVDDKWGLHLPLERQASRMALENLPTAGAQLWQYAELLARQLDDTYDALGDYVASSERVHIDETPWPMLAKGRKKWWAWTFSNRDAIYIRIDPSRGHQVPRDVLEGFEGVAATDGYSAYETLRRAFGGRLLLALCWAHARRKFIEAEAAYPVATEAIDMIRELFLIERELPDYREAASDAERADALATIARVRNEKSRPVIERLGAWAQTTQALPKSKLGSALAYLANQWKGLTLFLDEPRAPLDNNQAERTLRPAVVGRKNHYGSKSRRGTEVAQIFFSLIGTCQHIGVAPRDYLKAAVECSLRTPGDVLLPHDFLARERAAKPLS